jgi:hypothetical protein
MDVLQSIPYQFNEGGFEWILLSVKNDFSKGPNETLIYAQYENQYGHIKIIYHNKQDKEKLRENRPIDCAQKEDLNDKEGR